MDGAVVRTKSVLEVVLATIVFAATWVAAQSPQEVAQRGFESSATVLTFDSNGQALGIGSGFAVEPDKVLTNAHVVAGASRVDVRPIEGSTTVRASEILLLDEELDLVLLQLDSDVFEPLAVRGDAASVVGDAIYAVGSPLGLEGTFSQGIVSGYRTVGGVELMQITAPVSPGSSGGPVLNVDGELVGVAVGTLIRGQNLNFAIPVTIVSKFLDRAYSHQAVDVAEGIEGSDPAAEATESLTEAVTGTTLLFEAYLGKYSLSVRNELPRAITNVELLVVFYDEGDQPIDVDTIRVRQEIPSGLAQRVSSRVGTSVHEIVTGSLSRQDPQTRVEVRVLGFEFAD